MVVTVTHDGYIKRLPPSTYRAQNRGGRGITATNTKEGDFLEHMFVALTHDYILFFTDHGKVYWLKVYDLPMADADLGRPRDRQPAPARRGGEDHRRWSRSASSARTSRLMMVTRRGTVKKTELTAFKPSPGPGDHRPGARRGGPAHRRRPDQGGRPGGPEHPRRHGDPVRRVRRPLHGPARLTASRGSRWRRGTRSSAWSSPTATTTRRAS